MDGSALFATFLDALLADVERLRAGIRLDERLRDADADATDTTNSPAAIADSEPPSSFVAALAEPIGIATVTATEGVPQTRRAQRSVSGLAQALDWIVESRGTGFVRSQAVADLIGDPANRLAIRDRALAIIRADDRLSNNLVAAIPDSASVEEVLAIFHAVLHVNDLAEVLTCLDRMIDEYIRSVALDVAIESFRLRGHAQEQRQMVGTVRRGRNVLSALIRSTCLSTRHARWTHQLFVKRQLVRLATLKTVWGRRLLVAGALGQHAPTNADQANARRQNEIAISLSNKQQALGSNAAQRSLLRRSRAGASREQRREIAVQIEEIDRAQRPLRLEVRDLNQERRDLRRQLRGAALQRVQDYLAAEQQGIRRVDAFAERTEMLNAADLLLARTGIAERLNTGDEDDRWVRYGLFVQQLIRNSRGTGLELLMDSFHKVAQYTERRRKIGLEANARGHVQWLTYPGHDDGAVDLNCDPRLEVRVAYPAMFTVPHRLQVVEADRAVYRYAGTQATERVHATNELQDLFGHIGGALLRPERARDASSDDMSHVLSQAEGADLAPETLRGRDFRPRDVANVLIGLLSRELTSQANAEAFYPMRRAIVQDLERAVVRELRLNEGTPVFRRDVPIAGRGDIQRYLVPGLDVQDVRGAVIAVLRGIVTLPHGEERERPLHRIWRLMLSMRSAGAEDHRRAGSATIRHRYVSYGQPDLFVEVYYTHLHHIDTAAGRLLHDGDRLALSGMTGNAVNPHVHLEIRAMREESMLGSVLPQEFFPLYSAAELASLSFLAA